MKEGEGFSEIELGNVFSHWDQKWLFCWSVPCLRFLFRELTNDLGIMYVTMCLKTRRWAEEPDYCQIECLSLYSPVDDWRYLLKLPCASYLLSLIPNYWCQRAIQATHFHPWRRESYIYICCSCRSCLWWLMWQRGSWLSVILLWSRSLLHSEHDSWSPSRLRINFTIAVSPPSRWEVHSWF